MRSRPPLSAWGHVILHTAIVVRIRSTSYNTYSPLQLAFGDKSNISHLRTFDCVVYVPIALSQHTKLGPQQRLGFYIGYESPFIIKYVEPLIGDLFTIFADC